MQTRICLGGGERVHVINTRTVYSTASPVALQQRTLLCGLLLTDKNREMQIVDRENFQSYDANKDGVLDVGELRGWVLPDNAGLAEDEAGHLMSETDMDSDRMLSKKEVLQKHELWVGSHVADVMHMQHHVLHDPGELWCHRLGHDAVLLGSWDFSPWRHRGRLYYVPRFVLRRALSLGCMCQIKCFD